MGGLHTPMGRVRDSKNSGHSCYQKKSWWLFLLIWSGVQPFGQLEIEQLWLFMSLDLYLYLCTLAIYFRNWGLGFIYFLPCATRLVISICNNKWHVSSWSSSGIRWKPKRKKERCDNLQAITQIYSIWGESEIVGNVFKWRTGHQMCLLILCSPPFSFHDYLTLLSSILAMMYTIVCGRGQLSIPCWI